MVGRRSPQSPSINRLTSPPDQILSKCRRSRHQIPTPLATAPDPKAQVEPNNRASSAQHDTIAIYHDATRTIYLPEGWTGGTPAELSVLVHEVIHHFQNVLRLKYECPQEREKLAYIAQDRWLAQFGHSLEGDFHIDAFSLLVKTQCFW
jgi:uncharacterized protein DUF6647